MSWKHIRVTYAECCSITKYTTAGQALAEVIKKLIPQVEAGKKVADLCSE